MSPSTKSSASSSSSSSSSSASKWKSSPLQPLADNGQVDRSNKVRRGSKEITNKSSRGSHSKSPQGASSSSSQAGAKDRSNATAKATNANLRTGQARSFMSAAVAPHQETQSGSYELGTIRFVGQDAGTEKEKELLECATLLDRGVKGLLPNPRPLRGCGVGECFVARTRDGKGMGLFAGHRIPQGGVVLVERPVVVAVVGGGAGSQSGTEESPLPNLYARLIGGLKEEMRDEVLGFQGSSVKGEVALESILKTHAFTVDLGVPNAQDRSYRALFLKASRCNHSCGPNAMWRWDLSTYSLTLEATRIIHPNEEITIAYIDCIAERNERRHALKSKFNFSCYCPYCDVHWSVSDSVFQSDRARRELRDFFKRTRSFEEWCFDPNARDDELIKLHLWALDLRDREGVQMDGYKKHLDGIVMCFGALGDVERFRGWVGVVREVKVAEGNLEHVGVLDKWLRDPGSFQVWGWRKSRSRRG